MPSQLGTFIQLNATGTATNPTLLADVQRANQNAQQVVMLEFLLDKALNNLISGASTANIETALNLPSGQGTTYFDDVDGTLTAILGNGQNAYAVAHVNFPYLNRAVVANVIPSLQYIATQLQSAIRSLYATVALVLGEFNLIINGDSASAIESLLGLISGNGTTLFNIVNGASQVLNGTATSEQILNLAAQVG